MNRYICIHGHFYQPPRENPWLEEIELQDSARPYHDWNMRITAECYEPNTMSRILDDEDRITNIVNNYARISFNFGPTLLAWMEKKVPDVYRAILQADRESRKIFSGHGSAIAQAYNHIILPLAISRDKYTQVFWGIRDFEHRFGRLPEGMWLPETAVDLETLDILAERGIKFTILAPHQAKQTRPKGSKIWEDVNKGKIDTTRSYSLCLPSGRTIALFFYDGSISHAVAFEHILNKGGEFARRLAGRFSKEQSSPQLVHIATDGETYGHHHRFGNMALTYALHYIESNNLARITNYGEFLEKYPSAHEVKIFENTSWSCAHGVERWRKNCGCNSGRHPEWTQSWRAPLREALDWLRDMLATVYEEKGRQLLKDPWSARNDYIEIMVERLPETIERFLNTHAIRSLTEQEKITVLKLMELQRQTMLMYTSCGWFFDELSGIETIQVLQYAGRALHLGRELFGDDLLETHFLKLLERAKSNLPGYGNGHLIYNKFVRPALADMTKVAAHYAMHSLFEEYPQKIRIYCYSAERKDYHGFEFGKAKAAAGQVTLTSMITRESALMDFGVIYCGDHDIICGVRNFQDAKDYKNMVREVNETFTGETFIESIRTIHKHFENSTYSLKSLFRDEQQHILDLLLESTLSETNNMCCQLYETYAPLLRYYGNLNIPLPQPLFSAAESVLENRLRQALKDDLFDLKKIEELLEEAESVNISFDTKNLEDAFKPAIEKTAEKLLDNPADFFLLHKLESALVILRSFSLTINLWKVQNIFYTMLQTACPPFQERAKQGDGTAREWLDKVSSLCERLSIRIS